MQKFWPFLVLGLLAGSTGMGAVYLASADQPAGFRAGEVLLADGGPFTGSGQGPINITVRPGKRDLLPVAVTRPACDAPKRVCAAVLETLVRDLTFSGWFKVLNEDSFVANMARETLSQTKWEDWFNVGARYLVKSRITTVSSGKYLLQFRLYDVVQKKTIDVGEQEFGDVAEKHSRRFTHKFVNEVLETITGAPGPFGSSILYSASTGKETSGIFATDIDGMGRSVITREPTINKFPTQSGGHTVWISHAWLQGAVVMDGERISKPGREYHGAMMSPDGRILAVAAGDDDGQSDIYLMSPDGELKENLTNDPGIDVNPVWSPSGSLIAFVSDRGGNPQIYVMGRDGSNCRRITWAGSYNASPDFGPEGLLVFAGYDDGTSDIFTVTLGGEMTRITQNQGYNKDPTISRDGRHVAFVSNRDGKWKIYLSTMDGRYQYPITDKGGSYESLFWSR